MDSHDRDNCAQNLQADKREKITRLNDKFRRSGEGSQTLITPGIMALPERTTQLIVSAVRLFESFDNNNDPYGEHDFGALTVKGHKVFWKIDYYDPSMQAGSPDPSNPAVTSRVLTIMMASEY